MKEPILVIMAAGMGSRYGGLKQMDPVGEHGELIIDYSLYDAYRAGFRRVIFIIKKENETLFRTMIGNKVARYMETEYVFQALDKIPAGFAIPVNREKPWGTGHAVLCCKEVIDAPFAVINADDYYGAQAFKEIYGFLKKAADGEKYQYAMVGYELRNTLSESGHVARGICEIAQDGYLQFITERTHIIKTTDGPLYTDDSQNYHRLPDDSIVSMNFFGFTPSLLKELEKGFESFLRDTMPCNPLKGEFFLPSLVGELIAASKADVTMLRSCDRWHGVTYKADKEEVVNALCSMTKEGLYPENLWD